MKNDAEQHNSEENHFVFVNWLEGETARSLREAKGDITALREVIRKYLEIGYSSRLSSGQLVDYFCVSTPSILDRAGYTEEEADLAVKIYDEVNPELFARYYPNNK
jgi:hypothetical protein